MKVAKTKETNGGDSEIKESETAEPQQKPKDRVEQPAGSVLAKKFFESLDAILEAYEVRLKPLATLGKKG